MNKKIRNAALAVMVLAGGLSLGYIWSNYGFTPDAKEVSAVLTKNTGQILLDGKVVPDKSADLGFIVPATIKSITKKVGDKVKIGEVLAAQDSVDLQAQVSSAQASLAGAQAEFDKAGHDLKKEKLTLHGLSGYARRQQQAQISSNKDSVIVQKSAITSAQDGVISAKAQLGKTVLRAPFDGIITRQDGEIGEVGGASALPFLTITSSEPLKKIEAFASDLDVAKIKIGDSARVTFDILGSQKTVIAKVSYINPAITDNQGKSAYKITLMLDEAEETIKAGMHASVAL